MADDIREKGKLQTVDKTRKKQADFVAPDGGWGWVVLVAAGCVNLTTFPVIQQFGLLFRDRMNEMGIDNIRISSIINYNSAATSCIGLANGPMFRMLSFRQVSLIGTFFVCLGLILTLFSNGFAMHLLSFSLLYGAGIGMTTSASSIALNSYFKDRRRVATGLSWTITGFGPIVLPHFITFLMSVYGDNGTLLILIGVALHSFIFALLLQPVEWHAKNNIESTQERIDLVNNEKVVSDRRFSLRKADSIFSSQYLYNDDDPQIRGYEIIEPGFPMLGRGNDGYFTPSARSISVSKTSLNSMKSSARLSEYNQALSRNPPFANSIEKRARKKSIGMAPNKSSFPNITDVLYDDSRSKFKPMIANKIIESEIENCPILIATHLAKNNEEPPSHEMSMPTKEYSPMRKTSEYFIQPSDVIKNSPITQNNSVISFDDNLGDHKTYPTLRSTSHRNSIKDSSNNFNKENELLKKSSEKLEQYLENESKKIQAENIRDGKFNSSDDESVYELRKRLTFCQKITMFFDLDLLKDYTYINLMVGITISNFSELNFSVLTPFLLGDFGFDKPQVAMYLSIVAAFDISVRFFIPFIAGKIGWENKSFYLFGVFGMAMGRVVLAHCQHYGVVLAVAAWIGCNKALRTVFMTLVIPSHVPLEKLPGASGLQLLFAGLFFLSVGPLVGKIKDVTSISVTLHCLNLTTYITAICWGYEKWYRSTKSESAPS